VKGAWQIDLIDAGLEFVFGLLLIYVLRRETTG